MADQVDGDSMPTSPGVEQGRANSFGEVASQYERYRLGPPMSAIEWILPLHVGRVVDLGAGTGALTRMLVDRTTEVVAVEPDDRMRSVLAKAVPRASAVRGRGDSIPLEDESADAVLASSSWHWMDPIPTLHEVGRVLVPGGILGAVWSGPDPDGPFLVQAKALLAQGAKAEGGVALRNHGDNLDEAKFAQLIQGDGNRPSTKLEIPPGVPFEQPEHNVITWDVPLNADELIGLLGTFSWVILMAEEERYRLTSEARRLLRDFLGVEDEVKVDVTFRSDAWRSRRQG
jgi:SAM-dependent methyltransferase